MTDPLTGHPEACRYHTKRSLQPRYILPSGRHPWLTERARSIPTLYGRQRCCLCPIDFSGVTKRILRCTAQTMRCQFYLPLALCRPKRSRSIFVPFRPGTLYNKFLEALVEGWFKEVARVYLARLLDLVLHCRARSSGQSDSTDVYRSLHFDKSDGFFDIRLRKSYATFEYNAPVLHRAWRDLYRHKITFLFSNSRLSGYFIHANLVRLIIYTNSPGR